MRAVRHPPPEEIQVTDVLHALSDPVRLQIVRDLATREECCCNGLSAAVSKSTLSHHLKVLREAGLTRTRVEGNQRLISLREDDLEVRLPGLLNSVLGLSTVRAS
jgi:DNA-binding transcriptional ArsR family regulator